MLDIRYRGPAGRIRIGKMLVERDVVTRVSRADLDALGPKAERVEIVKAKKAPTRARQNRKET